MSNRRTPASPPETHEVNLAIYDLSHGMARSLSAQFLGPSHAIDIIPHTALVVYGREYYFGGGIQSCEPHEFRRQRNIFPVRVTTLGRTAVSRADFEAWCAARTADGTFAPESYDLLRRNCNDFSHEAATRGLHLSSGVPDWILGVPDRFLSSPMGQMMRPILDGMQITGPGAISGGQTLGRAQGTAAAPSPTPVVAISAAENPWANISAPSTTEANQSATVAQKPAKVKSPVLDSYNRPLLSSDTSTVSICISKITKSMKDEDRSSVEDLGKDLTVPNKALTHNVLEPALPILLRCLDAPSTATVFALMLLRIVALRPPADDGAALELKECAVLVGAKMIESSSSGGAHPCGRAAARAMAWCVLSNAAAADATSAFLLREDPALREGLVDAALADMSPDGQPGKDVRRSAAAFAYNVACCTAAGEEPGDGDGALPDLHVTLLCGALEGVAEEADPTARLRRLLVAGKIVCSGAGGTVNEAAKSLVTDLGFANAISALRESAAYRSDDAKKVKDLADELHMVLAS